MIDYDNLQKSLQHLQSQHAHYQSLDRELPAWMQEAVKESVIQRFETCYDCLWKVLRRYLLEELGMPDVPNSPKPILRIAQENKLLASPAEQWMKYADARVDTAHDYSGQKADSCLELMGDFIADALAIYQAMTGAAWE